MKPDFFGVPTYFVNHIDTENAGSGNVRFYLSSRRGCELIPECMIVMPLAEVLVSNAEIRQRASEIWNEEQAVPALAS